MVSPPLNQWLSYSVLMQTLTGFKTMVLSSGFKTNRVLHHTGTICSLTPAACSLTTDLVMAYLLLEFIRLSYTFPVGVGTCPCSLCNMGFFLFQMG